MATFRSPASQAEHAVQLLSAIGESRHNSGNDGRIHSLGTARNYAQALKAYGEWLQTERLGSIFSATRDDAMKFLDMRAGEVRQSTLDQDRQAIQALLGEQIGRIKSEVETHLTTRAYTSAQLQAIRTAQNERNAISTAIAECAPPRGSSLEK